MAYDRQGFVVFGGTRADAITWQLDASPELRAGMIATFDFARTGIDLARLRGLEIGASSGGRGYSVRVPGSGSAISGTEMLTWNSQRGRWLSLASNGDDVSSPSPFRGALVTPGTALEQFDRDRKLRVMLRSLAGIGNGQGPAEVAVDTIELRVSYETAP